MIVPSTLDESGATALDAGVLVAGVFVEVCGEEEADGGMTAGSAGAGDIFRFFLAWSTLMRLPSLAPSAFRKARLMVSVGCASCLAVAAFVEACSFEA